MEQIKIRCSKCGWETKVLRNELQEHAKCILCQAPMEIENLDQLYDMLRPQWINAMKHDIEVIGSQKVWEVIEGFGNPKARLAYRKLFFEAGGIR